MKRKRDVRRRGAQHPHVGSAINMDRRQNPERRAAEAGLTVLSEPLPKLDLSTDAADEIQAALCDFHRKLLDAATQEAVLQIHRRIEREDVERARERLMARYVKG